MNPDTNEFYVGDQQAPDHIPFTIGEEIEIKGHIFTVELIDIPKNPAKPHLLVLRPRGKSKPKPRPTIEELDKILNSEEDTEITINPDGSISAK